MLWRSLITLLLLPSFASAQEFKGYRATTLDVVINEGNGRTNGEGPGLSIGRPEKIKFSASMRAAPVPCSNGVLQTVLRMINFSDLLKQVSVTHCLTLVSTNGRPVVAFVQDVLVPTLKTDVRIGQPVQIYADFLAYEVTADRSRNAPILLVSRFEPQ
jgi:hypothetical protein